MNITTITKVSASTAITWMWTPFPRQSIPILCFRMSFKVDGWGRGHWGSLEKAPNAWNSKRPVPFFWICQYSMSKWRSRESMNGPFRSPWKNLPQLLIFFTSPIGLAFIGNPIKSRRAFFFLWVLLSTICPTSTVKRYEAVESEKSNISTQRAWKSDLKITY